jgi:hypothetical protein
MYFSLQGIVWYKVAGNRFPGNEGVLSVDIVPANLNRIVSFCNAVNADIFLFFI